MQQKEEDGIELLPSEEKFRRRYKMNGYPISHGICNSIIWPTMLHSMSHCGMLIMTLIIALIDKGSEKYRAFMKSLSMQFDFLNNGDIMSSTTAFLTFIKELRCVVCWGIEMPDNVFLICFFLFFFIFVRNAHEIHDLFVGGQYAYLKEIMPLMKMLLTSYAKFIVDSARERVGIVVIGFLLWLMIGLTSEVVIINTPKNRRKNKNNDNQDNDKDDNNNLHHNNNDNNILNDIDEHMMNNNNSNQNSPPKKRRRRFKQSKNKKSKVNMDVDDENENEKIYSPLEVLDLLTEKAKGIFSEWFGYATHLFDDSIWYFHLCHNHGGPVRDLLIYLGWAVHDSKYSAMFDERREEGSNGFQLWRTFRNLFRKRAPIDEPNKHQLRRDCVDSKIRRRTWKNSTYIEDTTFHMCDIYVDYTMVQLTPRLYPGMRYIMTKMDNFKQDNDVNYNFRDYFQFFTNGSFICKLDGHRDAQDIKFQFERNKAAIISVDGVFRCNVIDECDYETWERVAKPLHNAAIRETSSNDGIHCRNI